MAPLRKIRLRPALASARPCRRKHFPHGDRHFQTVLRGGRLAEAAERMRSLLAAIRSGALRPRFKLEGGWPASSLEAELAEAEVQSDLSYGDNDSTAFLANALVTIEDVLAQAARAGHVFLAVHVSMERKPRAAG